MVGNGERVCFAVMVSVGVTLACGGVSATSPVPHGGSGGRNEQSAGTGGGTTADGRAGAVVGGAPPGADAGGRAPGQAGTASSSAGASGSTTDPGGGGRGGESAVNPYARSGSFKMLVYSKTAGFRRAASIEAGKAMLQEIAAEQGFEVVMTETNELFTAEGLAQFEIVFFNNTTGDVFEPAEEQAYEKWMTLQAGAFAGVHAATDTQPSSAFYSEVTGQFSDGHTFANVIDDIKIEPGALNHPAMKGLPNPWPRAEEWMRFNKSADWTTKPGFQVLGRKAADGEPITWVREWGHFRSFYTGLGHDPSVFKDAAVKQHITGGIMWAVRREQLIR